MANYLASNNVKMYPSAYRGNTNAEAGLNTEKNLTQLKELSEDSSLNNYVYVEGSNYIIWLHGYRFDCNQVSVNTLRSSGESLWAYIITSDVSTQSYVNTKLMATDGSGEALDSSSNFIGLKFDTTEPTSSVIPSTYTNPKMYKLKVLNDSGNIPSTSKLKISKSEISNGDGYGIGEKLTTGDISATNGTLTNATLTSLTLGSVTSTGLSNTTSPGFMQTLEASPRGRATNPSDKFMRDDGTWSIPAYTQGSGTTYSFGTGTTNGTIKYKASTSQSYTNVSVAGLGSLAYKSSITTGDLPNGIPNNKLANSSITLGSTSTSLGGTSSSISGLTLTNCPNIGCTGTITSVNFNATSDKRLKENIESYECDKSILDLDVKKYDFINGSKNQIGCLAQDLQEICPEIVNEGEDGYLSIQESKIVYLLLNEVKNLKKEVEELKRGR